MMINRGRETKALTVSMAALWGGFIVEGLLATATARSGAMDGGNELLEHWAQGCLELVDATTEHVQTIHEELEKWFDAHPDDENDFPGVFEYEVVSAFGGWARAFILAQQQDEENGYVPEFPPIEDCREEIASSIAAFFLQAARTSPATPESTEYVPAGDYGDDEGDTDLGTDPELAHLID